MNMVLHLFSFIDRLSHVFLHSKIDSGFSLMTDVPGGGRSWLTPQMQLESLHGASNIVGKSFWRNMGPWWNTAKRLEFPWTMLVSSRWDWGTN